MLQVVSMTMWKFSTVSRQMLQNLAYTVVAICPLQSALPPMSSTWDSFRIRLYLTPVSSPRTLPCLKVSIFSISRRFESHNLYHAAENTANHNTGKLLYIRQYDVQPWSLQPLYFLCYALSWYTVEYRTCQLHFLGIQTRLKTRVNTEKTQLTCGTPPESIAVNWYLLFPWYPNPG